MKLLIVDDEKLTCEGLVASLALDCLQIDEVFLAADGRAGLALAKEHRPELILSDIRMPRLDGIEMAKQILTFLPDSSIILMSGYSDKDYLRAAIKLNAVSYIEKPINLLEVEEALFSAIQTFEQAKYLQRSRELHSQVTLKRLALELTYPANHEVVKHLLSELNLNLSPLSTFTTLILKSTTMVEDLNKHSLAPFHEKLKHLLANYHLKFFYTVKQNQYVIYHLYGSTSHTSSALAAIGDYLKNDPHLTAPFYIAIGESMIGVNHVYDSYASAVVLLQTSFFHNYGSVLVATEEVLESQVISKDFIPDFVDALEKKDAGVLQRLRKTIYTTYAGKHNLLPSQVKDIYYRLFMYIQHAAKNLHSPLARTSFSNESILENIEGCHNLKSLDALLDEKLSTLFIMLNQPSSESSPVVLMKKFIAQNYMNSSLSVKSISEHVHLSYSYLCTIFKTETRQTLNQYITEYRIDKAKQLLEDHRQKITEISSKVGYSDGNYFGKSFKKIVGYSPSEYRERMIS